MRTTGADSVDAAVWMVNLRDRYHAAGARTDLDRAIAVPRAALDAAPAASRLAAILRANLGAAQRDRYAAGRSAADLDEAIAHLAAAVRMSSRLDADRPRRLFGRRWRPGTAGSSALYRRHRRLPGRLRGRPDGRSAVHPGGRPGMGRVGDGAPRLARGRCRLRHGERGRAGRRPADLAGRYTRAAGRLRAAQEGRPARAESGGRLSFRLSRAYRFGKDQ